MKHLTIIIGDLTIFDGDVDEIVFTNGLSNAGFALVTLTGSQPTVISLADGPATDTASTATKGATGS